MSAFIDENTQFVDTGGNPIVNGKIYIGTKGANPKTSAITIYSNRALSSVLANPQTLNSAGRSTNKIYIPDVYSFQVDNAAGVQQIQDLDAGSGSSGGLIILSSVQGTNTITAVASPSITSYVDSQLYIFQAANANTGATTINIDSVGAKAVVDSAGALSAGDIATGRNSTLIYNSADDNFELQITSKEIGNVYIPEAANATADVAGQIQLWNKNTGTGLLHVTDDAGTDKEVSLVGNNIFINETAAAAGDTAGVGQIWVDDAVPNTLMFTNDVGTDIQLASTLEVTAAKVTQGTKVASTSGTAINFTGVPAGAKRVTLSMQGVSTNGTSPHRILIGDSGGLETSGYLGAQALVSSGGFSSSTGNVSDGMRITQTQAADTGNGTVVVNLIDASTNTWGMSVISGQTTNQLTISASSKSLSAALDRITYTTVNGSDAFDAGLINIQYEI